MKTEIRIKDSSSDRKWDLTGFQTIEEIVPFLRKNSFDFKILKHTRKELKIKYSHRDGDGRISTYKKFPKEAKK